MEVSQKADVLAYEKNKKPRYKPPKRREKKQTATEPVKPKRGWLRQGLAILLGIATLIGVPAAAVEVWPRMTATVSDPADASNAYSVTFKVSNAGFLPFQDVTVAIGICAIETEQGEFEFHVPPDSCKNGRVPNVMFSPPSWSAPELDRDGAFEVRLTDIFNIETPQWRASHPNVIISGQMMPPLKGANFILDVSFKQLPLLWRDKRLHFRFVAEEQPDGKVRWREVPLSWQDVKLPEFLR